ncbi:hypothetical protein B4135_0256 [Caldibacillus debilis]|uniref:Uncharacterized protein n=1 Tax=Caldibacillus debilis TaxID=301148 RepID=A0A150M8K9_9BACI|nr:hypothetical protein B4135_0256 [Caldibacillus debilis]
MVTLKSSTVYPWLLHILLSHLILQLIKDILNSVEIDKLMSSGPQARRREGTGVSRPPGS